MTKVNGVIIMFGCILKTQSIKECSIAIVLNLSRGDIVHEFWVPKLIGFKCLWLLVFKSSFLSRGLIICYVLAFSLPSNLTLFCFLDRINQWTHTFAISWIRFHKVYNMECICLIFTSVLYSEKIPLGKWLRPIIIFHIKFIFIWIQFYCFPEVSRFKTRFEN